MMLQNLKKSKNRIFPIISLSRGMKCRVKANNNRKAVVVCAKHVVKRPNKRSALVNNKVLLRSICIVLILYATFSFIMLTIL